MDWFRINKQAQTDKHKDEEINSLVDFNFGMKPASELDSLIRELKARFPGLDLYVYETERTIHLSRISVPKDKRGQGIGQTVIKCIQDYSKGKRKPLVLVPEAEPRYKQKLEDFYKNLGFVYNKGRNKNWNITVPFAKSMYWRSD